MIFLNVTFKCAVLKLQCPLESITTCCFSSLLSHVVSINCCLNSFWIYLYTRMYHFNLQCFPYFSPCKNSMSDAKYFMFANWEVTSAYSDIIFCHPPKPSHYQYEGILSKIFDFVCFALLMSEKKDKEIGESCFNIIEEINYWTLWLWFIWFLR